MSPRLSVTGLGRRAARFPAVVVLLLILAPPVGAQWLQWGGPHRDFTCDSTGLAERWPDAGPRRLWSRELGPGHSSILVDGERLYTMCRRGEKDVVVCLSAADGATVWETDYDAPPKEDMQLDFGCGPHSTPLIVGDRLFTVGAIAHFHCFDKQTGKVHWSHNLMTEMKASHLGRGYGSSPLAHGERVIVNVGGPEVGVAAFRQDTGEVAWKSEPLGRGYASPILARINDEDHLIVALGTARAGLDPATGATRWRVDVDSQSYGIITTPLFIAPDLVFCSAGYGGGTRLFRVNVKDGQYSAEELWYYRKMQVFHGTLLKVGDYVCGSSHGSFDPAFFMLMDLKTGKPAWRDRALAKANALLAEGKLIILDERGVLALATATPAGLTIHSQAKVLEEKAWTVPTLVGTKLYLRDNRTIMALDLGRAANP